MSCFITMHSLTGCLVQKLNFLPGSGTSRSFLSRLQSSRPCENSTHKRSQLGTMPLIASRWAGTEHGGQIYKKVKEQLSLKCQILWPVPWWNREIAKQIDTQTRYGKWSKRGRGGASQRACGVTWKANGMFQILVGNQPKKATKKLQMSGFAFHFINCFGYL